MSSLVVLLVVCVLVLSPCVSGSASYTLYSDAACTTQVATGGGIATQTASQSGQTVTQSSCFSITGVGGVTCGIINTFSGTLTGSTMNTYSDTAGCPSSGAPIQVVNAYSTTTQGGTGGACQKSVLGTTSAKFSISGAGHSAMLSMPILLLLLAGLLVVLI